ncbi:hypothetical protein [Muricoccus radiodurans]|uniref:OmpA/MotB family protein n=1 Tax=Muricoccus radiodurans TaxID=2231721 RepID=UPI003CFB3314
MSRARLEAGDEGGEGYFASISDLMVGILFVFLLMLTVLALNYREAEQRQMVEVERYEEQRRRAEEQEAEARRQAELARLARLDAERERVEAARQEAEARRLAEVVRLALSETERERAEAARQAMLARERAAEARRMEDTARLAREEAERERAEAARQADLARLARNEAERQEVNANVLRAQNERLRFALDAAVARLRREVREREEARAELLNQIRTELTSAGIRVRIEEQSGVLRLSEDVPFDLNRSELTERSRRTVTVLANVLARALPPFAGAAEDGEREAILEAVLIEGHTDGQVFRGLTPAQSVLENDRLSAARALSVFAELRRLQPGLEGLRNADGLPLLGLSGYGERRPVAAGMVEAAYSQNRRIDLRFVLSSRTSDEVQRLIEEIGNLRGAPP